MNYTPPLGLGRYFDLPGLFYYGVQDNMLYLVLYQLPTFRTVNTVNGLVVGLTWVEISTDIPKDPFPYEYRVLLSDTNKKYLIKYAMLHNYVIEGE